uniref:Altered inheritance of mitochondria protein 24, mitochondrial n=1 Tax=Noctiluca scintillans TaxID=2966 RepID=A0A7S1AL03_NOCSC
MYVSLSTTVLIWALSVHALGCATDDLHCGTRTHEGRTSQENMLLQSVALEKKVAMSLHEGLQPPSSGTQLGLVKNGVWNTSFELAQDSNSAGFESPGSGTQLGLSRNRVANQSLEVAQDSNAAGHGSLGSGTDADRSLSLQGAGVLAGAFFNVVDFRSSATKPGTDPDGSLLLQGVGVPLGAFYRYGDVRRQIMALVAFLSTCWMASAMCLPVQSKSKVNVEDGMRPAVASSLFPLDKTGVLNDGGRCADFDDSAYACLVSVDRPESQNIAITKLDGTPWLEAVPLIGRGRAAASRNRCPFRSRRAPLQGFELRSLSGDVLTQCYRSESGPEFLLFKGVGQSPATFSQVPHQECFELHRHGGDVCFWGNFSNHVSYVTNHSGELLATTEPAEDTGQGKHYCLRVSAKSELTNFLCCFLCIGHLSGLTKHQ